MTDEELVLLARQGDTSAFDQLMIRHQAAVYRAALAALRVPEDAEDVSQEAFVRAWSTLPRFRGEASCKTWLLIIAWNRAINRRRMRMHWWRRTVLLADTVTLVASSDAPDADLRSRELRTHIRRAIEALTPKLRDALLLAQSGEYGYDEIGAMLRIPEGRSSQRPACHSRGDGHDSEVTGRCAEFAACSTASVRNSCDPVECRAAFS